MKGWIDNLNGPSGLYVAVRISVVLCGTMRLLLLIILIISVRIFLYSSAVTSMFLTF